MTPGFESLFSGIGRPPCDFMLRNMVGEHGIIPPAIPQWLGKIRFKKFDCLGYFDYLDFVSRIS